MNFNNDAQVWLKRSEVIDVSDELSNIPPLHGVALFSLPVARRVKSRLRRATFWHPPSVPLPAFHTIKCLRVLVFARDRARVCVCVRLLVCVWLSSVCSNPTTRPTLLLPRMPLNPLQSLHHRHHFIYIPTALFEEYLRWGNLFSQCPSYRFTQTPMGLKSCCRTPGEAFSPNETKINRTVLSSHI